MADPTLLSDARKAIAEEIELLSDDLKRWGGDKARRIEAADLVSMEGDRATVEVVLDRKVYPPDFTGVVVQGTNQSLRGHVDDLDRETGVLTLSLDGKPKGSLIRAEVSFDPTQILRETSKALEEIEGRLDRLPLTLSFIQGDLGPVAEAPPSPTAVGALTASQLRATALCLGSPTVAVFGPPGTGKTHTIGAVAAELHQRGERVLILSGQNVAVDEALLAAHGNLGALRSRAEPGEIVRIGKARRAIVEAGLDQETVRGKLAESAAHPHAEAVEELVAAALPLRGRIRAGFGKVPKLPSSHLIRGRLRWAIQVLQTAAIRAPSKEVSGHLARAEEIYEQIEAATGRAEWDAPVVGATLARYAIDRSRFGAFDAVLVDEASQVGLHNVLMATGAARKRFHLFGDPKQNQPIAKARSVLSARILQCNGYRHLGIGSPSSAPDHAPVLTEQFRMDPEIRALANGLVYEGLLTDHPTIAAREPYPAESLVLLDTSDLGYLKERKGSSRRNPATAELAVEIATRLSDAGETDIGLITPFRPQSQLYSDAIREWNPGFWRAGGRTGTVHSYQGAEADTVIIDLVDTPPGLGFFLSPNNRGLVNLLTVAMTRARRSLIVIGHATGYREAWGTGAPLVQFLGWIARRGVHIRPAPGDPTEVIMEQIMPGAGQRTLV